MGNLSYNLTHPFFFFSFPTIGPRMVPSLCHLELVWPYRAQLKTLLERRRGCNTIKKSDGRQYQKAWQHIAWAAFCTVRKECNDGNTAKADSLMIYCARAPRTATQVPYLTRQGSCAPLMRWQCAFVDYECNKNQSSSVFTNVQTDRFSSACFVRCSLSSHLLWTPGPNISAEWPEDVYTTEIVPLPHGLVPNFIAPHRAVLELSRIKIWTNKLTVVFLMSVKTRPLWGLRMPSCDSS